MWQTVSKAQRQSGRCEQKRDGKENVYFKPWNVRLKERWMVKWRANMCIKDKSREYWIWIRLTNWIDSRAASFEMSLRFNGTAVAYFVTSSTPFCRSKTAWIRWSYVKQFTVLMRFINVSKYIAISQTLLRSGEQNHKALWDMHAIKKERTATDKQKTQTATNQ